jgi:hypothetical protein
MTEERQNKSDAKKQQALNDLREWCRKYDRVAVNISLNGT